VANIIIQKWDETPGERSLRQKGHRTKENAVMETGVELGADELRKENAGEAFKKIAKALWALRNQMAEQGWDDDKVLIVVGIQARNGWEKTAEGEWIETGSQNWLDRIANKAKGR
jgi:hypothetical protein